MNLAQSKVIEQVWDLARTRVGSPAEQEALEQIPLVKSSLVLASGDPYGRSARPSQARWAIDREEYALCMGKEWRPAPTDSSQTKGARGYALFL